MITAQEAYTKSQVALGSVNVMDVILEADRQIRHAVSKGWMACTLQPLDPLVAEKAALELQASGYCANVVPCPGIQIIGEPPGVGLAINWKWHPSPTRGTDEESWKNDA